MGKFQIQRKHSNIGLFVVIAMAYILLLGLFGWQTWEFVNFLFPDDQLLMKLLTVFSFDVMALIFGCAHLFYSFAHPHAKSAVAWGWAITNLLSLTATIIYMVIQSMFRFHITIATDVVNFGYGVTIAALVFDIGMIAVFLYKEIGTRFPNEDEFELVDAPTKTRHQPPALPVPVTQQNQQQSIMSSDVADFAAFQQWKQSQQTSPLQQSPLQVKADQAGATNGQNGH